MLNLKQGGIKYHFLSLWYDSIWDWTPVSRAFGEHRFSGLVGRLFANGLEDLGSIPVRVIPKTLRMVLDNPLLKTQQYKVRIKGKVEQSKERSGVLSYTTVL